VRKYAEMTRRRRAMTEKLRKGVVGRGPRVTRLKE